MASAVRGAAGHAGRIAAAHGVEETGDRRDAWVDGPDRGDLGASSASAQLEDGVEDQLQRGVGALHVEGVERRDLLGAPRDVARADSPAREAQKHGDRVVERARPPAGEREQTAARSRLHRFDRTGERDLEIDVVAGELE